MRRAFVILLVAIAAAAGCTSTPAPKAPFFSSPTTSVPPPPPPRPQVTVPNLAGKTTKQAKAALSSLGLVPAKKARISWLAGPGRVYSQSQSAGQMVNVGVRVSFTIAKIVAARAGCPRALGNPWAYTFVACGSVITHPAGGFCIFVVDKLSTFCIGEFYSANGYVMECRDGTFGKSGGISGSCSSHNGNWRPLYKP